MDASSKPVGASDFLVSGGEMGARMRATEWSKTPLGAVETWSSSLKTAVSICLNSRFPMVIWWGRGLVVLYNDAWRPILGENKDRYALGSFGKDVWPEIWDVLLPMFNQVLNEGKATWSDDRLLLVNRYGFTEEAYFTWSYSPIRDDDGSVEGVFTAVTETTRRVIGERRLKTLRDLGERLAETKTAEQVCQTAAATLAENPNDLSFAALYLLAEDGKSAKLYEAAGLVPGTTPAPEYIQIDSNNDVWNFAGALTTSRLQIIENLGDKHGRLTARAGADDFARQAVVAPLAKAGSQESPAGFLVAGISPRLRFDDEYRGFLELVAGGIATAVANSRAYGEERRRAVALAQIDRAKTAFFSNVSHEFRTPLTLILGPTEEMLSGILGDTTEIQRAHLRTLRHNALRLHKLVNTLLDFARVEAGRIEANYEPVNLGLLTRDLASTFCSAVHRAGLLYIVNCPSLEEPVYVDRDMWEKIVLNLLSNALKFTFTGAIDVSIRPAENSIVFAVRDSGVGIPEAELPRLFDRFHRVQGTRARTQEGSGIGLALVHELVKLHGGTLQVDSALGKGTTVTVFIPTGAAHLPNERLGAPPTLSSTALGAAPFVEEALRWLPGADHVETLSLPVADVTFANDSRSVAANSELILVADDNLEMRNYLKRLLETQWNVTVVEDGAKALETAREQRPDLVLSDVMLPAMDGFELLRQLREDHRTSTIPVILLSARAGEEAYIEGMNAGADDYIVKPFGARELVARIRALLEVTRVRRESEERFRTMADSSPIMIWLTDAEGRPTFFNRTYLDYFGIAAEQTATFDWPAIVHPEDRATYVAAFKDALESGRTFQQRARLRRFDGQWRWFESRGNPILDAAGRMTGYIGSSPDITDIYESQQALKELGQRKDEFLANMSHEIRSPLTGIMGYADLLRTRLTDPEDVDCLRTIKESGEYLIEIVNDILDLSKIEAGKLVLNIEAVSPHAVLGEIHGLMDVRAREKKLPLVLRYDGALPATIHTDRTRLRQIVINLVSNAIKFTEHGHVEIVARFVKDEGWLQVEVIDTGIGIAPEHQQNLFEPFTQSDSTSTRRYGGTGLGLTITRRLIEMLGGSISFESECDKGSRFCVTIPTVPTQPAALPVNAVAPVDPTPAEPPLRDRRVLVVDDRKEFCYLISKYVKDAGGRPHAVGDGETAIEAVEAARQTDPFHAVIMDIQMPAMDGYEATRRIRAKGFQLPIIALTAAAMVGDREKCLQAGCDDYLTKPIDRSKLVQLLARHTQKAARGKSVNGDSLKIMLVDDSDAMCKLLTAILEKRGHEIRTAFDGESAILIAQDYRPDVIFIDIRLPDMNGYELMQQLKELNGTRRAKFIALSGSRTGDSPGPRDFDHFLEKPLNVEDLDTILCSL